MSQTEKDYYSVSEAAELLNMSVAYIHSLIKDKKIASIKEPDKGGQGGFRYLIPQFEVGRMLDAKHGAIESAKDAKLNQYVTLQVLANASGIPLGKITEDVKAGILKYDFIEGVNTTGPRKGVQIAEAKKYVRKVRSAMPSFLSEEEFAEVLK